MRTNLACIIAAVTTACSPSIVETNAVPNSSQHPPETDLPQDFTVTSAYVFIPKWEGAEGFSAGGKYVIQGELFNEDRSKLSDGGRLIGLPADASAAVVFELVQASLKTKHVEVMAAGKEGQQYTGDGTNLWLVYDNSKNTWHDLTESRLFQKLDEGHRPHGEGEHALKMAIDLNGDAKPDYAEFSHYCKVEEAPYPLDEAGRADWQAKHGEVDWDATCTNTFTIRAGQWTKTGRKTPM